MFRKAPFLHNKPKASPKLPSFGNCKISNLDLKSPKRYHAPVFLDPDLEESKELSNPGSDAPGTDEPPLSTRSRCKAQSFVFVSDDILNDPEECKMHILEDSNSVLPHDILQQLRSIDSSVLSNKTFQSMEPKDVRTMDNATRYFYNFLKNNKLDKYFHKFEENECCDIRDIEYLIDPDFFQNVIGISNPIHIRKMLALFTELKHKMDDFKAFIPHVLIAKLSTHGIVTMDILCGEIETKSDLTHKLHIHNPNQCQLLWNIIDLQINPRVSGHNSDDHDDGTYTETKRSDALPLPAEGDAPAIRAPRGLRNDEFEVVKEETPTPGRIEY